VELLRRGHKIEQKGPLKWDERVCDPSAGEEWPAAGEVGVGGLNAGHEEQQLLPVRLRCLERRSGEEHMRQHRVAEVLDTIRSWILRGRRIPGKLLRWLVAVFGSPP
jgi:hypothetical protein